MYRSVTALTIALVAGLAVTGCGNKGGRGGQYFNTTTTPAPIVSRTPPTTTTTTAPIASSRFLYTTDAQSGVISHFAIEKTTGALKLQGVSGPVGRQVLPAGYGSGVLIVGADDAGHLYATNAQSGDVTAFSIDPATGALAKTNEWNLPRRLPSRGAISPDGKWLVVQAFPMYGNTGGGWLMVCAIDSATGDITATSELPVDDLDNPRALAFDRASRNLYGIGSHSDTGLDSDKVAQWSLDARGTLAPVAKVSMGVRAVDLAVDPGDGWVFVLAGDGSIKTLERDRTTGSLTATGSTPAGGGGGSLGLAPDGKRLVVTNATAGSETVQGYSVGAGGILTAVGKPATAGPAVAEVRVDPSGRYAFACNLDADHVTAFVLDAQGGVSSALRSKVTTTTARQQAGPTSLWLVR